MEQLEFAKALGENIILSQHDYFVTAKSEDLEHITNLRRIIVAIAEYLKSEIVSMDKFDDVLLELDKLNATTVLSSHLPPAQGINKVLLSHLRDATQAPRFVGPDQAMLQTMMAA